ncbi:MAG: hypothetical protein JXA16_09290 [Bacteroidales bacterium]|nr:hypothetical protein [Bacteroidales bacterium]
MNLSITNWAQYLNENTKEGETVYLVNYSSPEFYLNGPQPCHMLRGADLACVEQENPQFIVFSNNATQDASWDRESFIEKLITNFQYRKIFGNPVVMSREILEEKDYLPFSEVYINNAEKLLNKDEYYSKTNEKIFPISSDSRVWRGLFQHPDEDGDYYLNYDITPKLNDYLVFSIGISDKMYYFWKGDGVVFEIFIENNDETNKVFSKYLNPQKNKQDRGWHDFELDLSDYEDQEITIKFLTLPGPNNNYNYDWAYWGEPRIENKK